MSNVTAIIVGNGPASLDRRLGRVIDLFDVVIRLNDFTLESFEEDLGTKTDIWVTNGGRVRMPRDTSMFKESWICSPDFDRQVEGVVNYIPKCVIEEVNSLFRVTFGGGQLYPTTGLYCVNFFAQRFGRVYSLGLNDIGNKQHYFDGGNYNAPTMSLNAHHPGAEDLVFKHWMKSGFVVPI